MPTISVLCEITCISGVVSAISEITSISGPSVKSLASAVAVHQWFRLPSTVFVSNTIRHITLKT